MTNSTESLSDKFVLFELLDTTYAVRSRFVRRLEMVENVTPVPNATSIVEGVVLSRGRVIPVINLRARFGFPKIPVDLTSRLLVIESDGRTVGLIVDSSREFKTISEDDIKTQPEAIANLSGEYLDGIATIGNRMVLILKVDEILKVADQVTPDAG